MRPSIFTLLTCLSLVLSSCAPIALPTPQPLPPAPFSAQNYTHASAWNFVDPRVEGIPELMVLTDQGYQVDEQWEVQAIDYVSQWWGMETGTFDYQHIECQAGQCQNGAVAIAPADMQAFRAALSNFYPVQYPIEGALLGHSFMANRVELLGQDGRRVLLFMNGTSPHWNLLFNGRLYTQYNGALLLPLAQLFVALATADTLDAEAMATVVAAINAAGIRVDRGWPTQLANGFGGLLPIADGFSYQVNVTAQTLTLRIQLPNPKYYGSVGMLVNEVVGITAIEISAANQPAVACQSLTPTADIASVILTFACPLNGGLPSAQTPYQLQVEGSTRSGPPLKMTGELWGLGSATTATLLLPLPAEIATALAAHPAAHDLLTDHAALDVDYSASLATTPQHRVNTLIGAITLAGQTTWAGQTVRYTVLTPIVIENGQLQRWDLDRQALQSLLANILAAPLTQQVFAVQPNTELTLWYAQYAPPLTDPLGQTLQAHPETSALFQWEMQACADLPSGVYPSSTTPLQGVSYSWQQPTQSRPWRLQGDGISYSFRQPTPDPQFLWLADQLWPLSIRFEANGAEDILPQTLLPLEIAPTPQTPFTWVSVYRGAQRWSNQPYLNFSLPDTPHTQAAWAAYEQLAQGLNTPLEKDYLSITAEGFTLVVDQAGQLQLQACASPAK